MIVYEIVWNGKHIAVFSNPDDARKYIKARYGWMRDLDIREVEVGKR